MDRSRRRFLGVLGSATAGAMVATPAFRAFAQEAVGANEFFLCVHAQGGWDVTLGLDPRNELQGLVQPGTTNNLDVTGLRRWTNKRLSDGSDTFEIYQPSGSALRFGPTVDRLATDFYDRLCVINGIAMNTVSHPDGTYFSTTGRHLAGGRPVSSSIDTMLAQEFGLTQLFPVVSVNYPSAFVGDLDRRAVPLQVGTIGTVARSLTRATAFDTAAERDAVTVALTAEARTLAARSYDPAVMEGFALQFEALRRILRSDLRDAFDTTTLKRKFSTQTDAGLAAEWTEAFAGTLIGSQAVNAAFAVEAISRNVTRCVSFGIGSFDTHNTNYEDQGQLQQDLFDLLHAIVRQLEATAHPTVAGARLIEHTHILVVSDFCRTPQINLTGGRDHYPNNSSLVISPRWRGNVSFGASDAEQLLPMDAGSFADGRRPVAPPDVLATMLGAFGVDPREYMRDGDVIRTVLRAS